MVKSEFDKNGNYKAVVYYSCLADLHSLIDELIEYVGDYKGWQPSVPQVEDDDATIISISSSSSSLISETELKTEPQTEVKTEPHTEVKTEPQPTIAVRDVEVSIFPSKFESRKQFEEQLKKTDLKESGFKNYLPFWNDPVWEFLEDKEKLHEHLKTRIANARAPYDFDLLYRLFCVIFKFKILSVEIDKEIQPLFDIVKTERHKQGKKKTPTNATK